MNIFKKMTLMVLMMTGATLMFPVETFAQQDLCYNNSFGVCQPINPPSGNVWIGAWINSDGFVNTVSANNLAECTALLEAATAGQTAIVGQCRRR